ncbi:MAG: hypothetical protein GY835_02145 [bacterium]|nr:hypothetical protein [bacterium]
MAAAEAAAAAAAAAAVAAADMNMTDRRLVQLDIYLGDATIKDSPAILSKLQEFASCLDSEIEQFHMTKVSSVFIKVLIRLAKKFASGGLDMVIAGLSDERFSGVLSPIRELMDSNDDVIVHADKIIAVKLTSEEGQSRVVVTKISRRISEHIADNPELLFSPTKIIKVLEKAMSAKKGGL